MVDLRAREAVGAIALEFTILDAIHLGRDDYSDKPMPSCQRNLGEIAPTPAEGAIAESW
jgi:hypothetical protein